MYYLWDNNYNNIHTNNKSNTLCVAGEDLTRTQLRVSKIDKAGGLCGLPQTKSIAPREPEISGSEISGSKEMEISPSLDFPGDKYATFNDLRRLNLKYDTNFQSSQEKSRVKFLLYLRTFLGKFKFQRQDTYL